MKPSPSIPLISFEADKSTAYGHIWSPDIHISSRTKDEIINMMLPTDIFSRIYDADKETAFTLMFMQTCIESRMGKEISPTYLDKIYKKARAIAKDMTAKIEEGQKKRMLDSPIAVEPPKSMQPNFGMRVASH